MKKKQPKQQSPDESEKIDTSDGDMIVREEPSEYMRFVDTMDELLSIPPETAREIVEESEKERSRQHEQRSSRSTRK